MKNQRTLIVLVIVFLALAILLILQGSKPSPVDSLAIPPTIQANSEDNPGQYVYIGWDVSEIFAIRLEDPRSGASFTIQKDEDDQWIVPSNSGPNIPINQDVALGIAQTIPLIEYQKTLEVADSDQYADFGLSQQDARLFIQIIRLDGQQHIIAIGNMTATGEGYYTLVDEHPDVYIIQRDPDPVAFLQYYLIESQN